MMPSGPLACNITLADIKCARPLVVHEQSNYHLPGGTMNQGNMLGDKPCVRQSRLFRVNESGDSVKILTGTGAHAEWLQFIFHLFTCKTTEADQTPFRLFSIECLQANHNYAGIPNKNKAYGRAKAPSTIRITINITNTAATHAGPYSLPPHRAGQRRPRSAL